MNKITEVTKKVSKKTISKLEGLGVAANALCMSAAFNSQAWAVPTINNMDTAVGSVVGFVIKIFTYIGWIFAVWGLGSLIFAFKNDDPDSKQKSGTYMIVGIALVAISTIVDAVLGGGASGTAINV